MNVKWEIVALDLIIELKSFITQRSTRSSFVQHTLARQINVIMERCVLLLIQKRNSQWIFWISSPQIQISTFSILRQYGVHTVTLLTLEMHVYMHITGKTLEESHISLSMKETSALSGRPKTSFRLMLTDANMNIDVNILMAGKNKSTTHSTIRYTHVEQVRVVLSLTVPTITMIQIADNL